MQSNNYEWFITQTVESMLPCFHDRNICLGMKVKMEWTDHGYDKDGNTKIRDTHSFIKEVLLIFHRPSNYTKVLMRDISKEQHFWIDRNEMEFEQLSDHDSCWRSDGMRWIFQTFVEAWDYFEQFDIEGRDIEPMFHYDIFNGAPAYYHLEKMEAKDKDSRWISPFIVKIGKKIEMHEISEYMPT
jgi:hypothetical protein